MNVDGKSVGLALSGGGFRACLFGLGSLWRLNDAGLLGQLACITSVSGGSIVSGVLAHAWRELDFHDGRASNFEALVADKVRRFCSHTIDFEAGVRGLLNPFRSAGDYLIARYRDELFGDTLLKDLPRPPADPTQPGPRVPTFIFYATNMQTGRSFRMQQNKVADYKLGELADPKIALATAVAASSAFPPVFSPIVLETDPAAWISPRRGTEQKVLTIADPGQLERLRKRIVLADGGIYDNMGLQRLVGDGSYVVLASDAGARFEFDEDPNENYVSQLGRVRDILIDQTRALRKFHLVDDFKTKRRAGAYWGVGTDIADYWLADALAQDSVANQQLEHVPTRLGGFDPGLQARLVNWGYALCDAALRSPRSSAGLVPAANGRLPMPVS